VDAAAETAIGRGDDPLAAWQLSIITAAMMLSPVLAFPIPIGVEILIDFLMEELRTAAQALVLLRDVWPRERAVRTEETSERLFDLAIDTDGDRFTLLVDTVTPLMITVRSDALGVIELTRVGDEEARART
jgi:hypothetical protein